MDIIIRPAETSDFDSVVHILNQVQALHVNWRPDIYKESKDFLSLDAFQDALDKVMPEVDKIFDGVFGQ